VILNWNTLFILINQREMCTLKQKLKKLSMFTLMTVLVAVQFFAFVPPDQVAKAGDNGLALKPLMGWSSYSLQVYDGPGNWISEAKIKQQSDAMKTYLQPYGYEYINIDAGWNGDMDSYGRPIPSTTNYPNGFTNLVDYVHNNGQKIGLYFIPGLSVDAYNQNLQVYNTSCRMQDITYKDSNNNPVKMDYWNEYTYKIDFSHPCAQSYIDSIADLLGDWGVDFVKFDSVMPGSGENNLNRDAREDVKAWYTALSRHNIWLELSWALDHNYVDWWKQYSNGWRIHWDIEAYDHNKGMVEWANVSRLFPEAAIWWRDAGPGGWNDFDSLNVGNGTMNGITMDERRTAATFWAVSAAQFYIGDDMTQLDSFGLSLLTNEEVIAVNQAGRPAHPISMDSNQQVWYANLGDGSYNVAFFNLGSSAAPVSVNWSEIGLDGQADVRDLWSGTDLGTHANGFSDASVPAHGSRLFKVTGLNGTSSVNDDDTGIRYTGDWIRNGGTELQPEEQDVMIRLFDSAAIDNSHVIVNNDDPGIVYNGGWWRSSNRGLGDYMDDVQVAESTGDFFEYTFYGTGIDYVTEKHNSQGEIDIYVDDVFQGTINTYLASGREVQKSVYSITGLPYGQHTIKAVMKSGWFMLLDHLRLHGSPGAIDANRFEIINNSDDRIQYNGSWWTSSGRGVGDYLDQVQVSEQTGNSLTFTFNGKGIQYVTELSNSQGEVEVYIDNVLVKTVTAQRPNGTQSQKVVYSISNLAPGEHTIELVHKNGQFMLLDHLKVELHDLITPVGTQFDRNPAHQADVLVSVSDRISTLDAITNGSIELTEGTDYTISGSTVAIKAAFLAAQTGNAVKLKFQFAGDYHNDVHHTSVNGDSFTYTFQGTGIEMIAPIGPEQGEVDIYLDGTFYQTIDMSNTSRKAQQNVLQINGLTHGEHTIRAVKKSGSKMIVDKLVFHL